MSNDDCIILLQLLRGSTPTNTVTSYQISKAVGASTKGTMRYARNLTLVCMENYGVPIAANNKGYFIAREKSELKEYMKYLNSHIYGYARRKKAISKTFRNPKAKIIRRRKK
jgi:hypothetical protein